MEGLKQRLKEYFEHVLDSCDDDVTITCYNNVKKMKRGEALAFYEEAMFNSEGSEHERYETIYQQLLYGCMECRDCN